MRTIGLALVYAAMAWPALAPRAMAAETANSVPPASELAAEQRRLADRYQDIEDTMSRLVEQLAAGDAARAALLRQALGQGQRREVDTRLEEIVALLKGEQLRGAIKSQQTAQTELKALLELLLREDLASQRDAERKRLGKLIQSVDRLIRQQRGVRARTEGGDDLPGVQKAQESITDKTGELADQLAEEAAKNGDGTEGQPSESGPAESQPNEGQPSEGQPSEGQPSEGQQKPDSIQEKIEKARQRMQQATDQLEQAQRDQAAEEQRAALDQLEQAKAELEELLRQLREEELEQMLAMLESRFRKMLDVQIEVYEATVRLDPSTDPGQRRVESGRLSRREAEIATEAQRALTLLRDEGSSVAFPEAVGQMQEDMLQIVERLAMEKTSGLTQSLEQDVIAALEEMVAALKRAQQEQQDRQQQPPQEGEPNNSNPPLVDNLAELKMIRALQMRVNRRTQRYAKLLSEGEVDAGELREPLAQLSDRQRRLVQVTRDIAQGKNK